MTLDVSYTCDACKALVEVPLQVPDGISCRDVAVELDRYDFEARVEHDVQSHTADLLAAADEIRVMADVLARPDVRLMCGENRIYCRDGAA